MRKLARLFALLFALPILLWVWWYYYGSIALSVDGIVVSKIPNAVTRRELVGAVLATSRYFTAIRCAHKGVCIGFLRVSHPFIPTHFIESLFEAVAANENYCEARCA
jgi:hypothetical protein